MTSSSVYHDTTFTLENGEEVTLTLRIKAVHFARWSYIFDYFDEFMKIFSFEKKI